MRRWREEGAGDKISFARAALGSLRNIDPRGWPAGSTLRLLRTGVVDPDDQALLLLLLSKLLSFAHACQLDDVTPQFGVSTPLTSLLGEIASSGDTILFEREQRLARKIGEVPGEFVPEPVKPGVSVLDGFPENVAPPVWKCPARMFGTERLR